jgi:hypothetical protein
MLQYLFPRSHGDPGLEQEATKQLISTDVEKLWKLRFS